LILPRDVVGADGKSIGIPWGHTHNDITFARLL
jgi:hypothetical protein